MKTEAEIINVIQLGEDSSRQFKEKLNNATQIAIEMCAMSNSTGGIIFVGVKDDGTISGLEAKEIQTYNQWISAAANEHIKPPVYPRTQTIEVDGEPVMLIHLSEGVSKPYCDKDGIYWIKSGSDKRKASPQELARMFQESGQIQIDETATTANIDEIDLPKFYTFFEKNYSQQVGSDEIWLDQVLPNMNLARGGKLTLAGLLLFGKNPQTVKPFCLIRAVAYPGSEISDDVFNDKRDCMGSLDEQFRSAMTFLKNNLSRVQTDTSFNSKPSLEIDERALEEAVVNALLHRDYSKNGVIRLLVFKDRVEIVSPGKLPNHLSVENIKSGNSVMRNPLMASFGTKILPYSGIGSGIPRIIRNHPATELINDQDGEQFTIILKRNKRP
ncbi:MAG: RNA-binding domain-containing protein [Imperialibacter sp.]|uniref:RNA-binding domain-containing protein n=1 Tax=Imperialibacter sp. TaxID=2038411 RepID=UPI003A85CDB9